jgi:hypothetical protein
MTDRAKKLIDEIWNERNIWANTENKLISVILKKATEHCRTMVAQKMNNLTVIDKNDMIALANEIENYHDEGRI